MWEARDKTTLKKQAYGQKKIKRLARNTGGVYETDEHDVGFDSLFDLKLLLSVYTDRSKWSAFLLLFFSRCLTSTFILVCLLSF